MKSSYLVLWGATVFGFACGPGIQRPRAASGSAAVFVLDETALAQLPGRTVLDAITLRMPQVRTFFTTGGCPGVLLRGQDRLMGPSNPDVYVDHAHALDTCLLATLWATDLQRVEIYPHGVTSRPGYGAGAHGLILIFTLGSRAK